MIIPPRLVECRNGVFKVCLMAILVVSMVLVFTVLLAIHRTGAIEGGFAYLRGESIYAPSRLSVSGDGTGGQTIVFTNLSMKSVRITGYEIGCPCVRVDQLPVELASGQSKNIPIRAAAIKTKIVPLVFNTDVPGQSRFHVDVTIVAASLQ